MEDGSGEQGRLLGLSTDFQITILKWSMAKAIDDSYPRLEWCVAPNQTIRLGRGSYLLNAAGECEAPVSGCSRLFGQSFIPLVSSLISPNSRR